MISLRKIDWHNFDELMQLSVKDEQSTFVAPIAYSLAQAYTRIINHDKPPFCFAIYHDEQLIGHTLIMYYQSIENIYGDDDCYVINRFLISEAFQGKGYGSKSLAHILDFIKTFPQGSVQSLYLSCNPRNNIARSLYSKFGFKDTGRRLSNGENIYRFNLDD